MSLDLTYEPLLSWPGALRPAGRRSRAPFTANWSTTLGDLDREVRALGSARAWLRIAHPPHAFRQDGGVHAKYQDRVPEHPGVVLVVPTRKHGNLTYSTDAFDRWRDNVRAIALGLESLRRVERYGIADEGQQYAGFAALGSGIAQGIGRPVPITLDEAAALLADPLSCAPAFVLADAEVARKGYRAALRLLHPDHGGTGDGERMARLQEAWVLVKAHHRIDGEASGHPG